MIKTSGSQIAVSPGIVDSNTEGPTVLSVGDRRSSKTLGVLLSDKAVSCV